MTLSLEAVKSFLTATVECLVLQFRIIGLSGTGFSQDTTASPRSVIDLLGARGFSFEHMPLIIRLNSFPDLFSTIKPGGV